MGLWVCVVRKHEGRLDDQRQLRLLKNDHI